MTCDEPEESSVPIQDLVVARPPTRREVRIALGLTAFLLFFVVVVSAVFNDPRGFDFACFYATGWSLRQGHAAKLFDVDEQARTQRELLRRGDVLINPHPPFESLLFAPLSKLPYTAAYILFGVVNVLFWLLFQHVLRPHARVPKQPYRYFLLCSAFLPLWLSLVQGQTSLLLLVCLTLAFACLERGEDFKAGAALGLGLFKFPIVLPFVLVFLLRGKWRLMAGFSMVAIFWSAISLATVGFSGVISYLHLLLDIARSPSNPAYGGVKPSNMPTLRAFLSVLMGNTTHSASIGAAAAVASAVFIAYTAWCWRRAESKEASPPLRLMFAASLTVSLVTAPHLYTHDLTVMLLPVLLVIGSSQCARRSTERTVLLVVTVILYAAPLQLAMLRWHANYLLAPVLVAFALAAISLARQPATSDAATSNE
jgi:cbb3-type cytochrome oxidase subunit 3